MEHYLLVPTAASVLIAFGVWRAGSALKDIARTLKGIATKQEAEGRGPITHAIIDAGGLAAKFGNP